MVLVYFFYTIIFAIILFMIFIILSTIKIRIENLLMTNMSEIPQKQQPNYHITFSLYLFNRVKWFSISINRLKMQKLYSKIQLDKIDIKKIEKDFSFQDLKLLKKIKPNVSLLNLELKIGTEDAILTSFIVFLISTGISILLPHVIKRYDKNKYKYLITPLYFQKNLYQIKLNCIIEIKLVHIINMIYIFIKKRRSDKNERTSNRRPYDYSYE